MSRPHGTFNLHGAEKRKKIKDPLRGIYNDEKRMRIKHVGGKDCGRAGCRRWSCDTIRILKEARAASKISKKQNEIKKESK